MASEAKQETNRSDPDVVRLGPKFAPGTWFWQEAPEPARKGARAKPPRWAAGEVAPFPSLAPVTEFVFSHIFQWQF